MRNDGAPIAAVSLQQRQANMKYLVIATCLGLAGCSTLLPRGNHAVEGPWKSFEEAQQTFDLITPYQTRVADLRELGLDPSSVPNVTLLNYSDVVVRFIPSPAISADALDAGVRDCIQSQAVCRGFEIDQRHIKRRRTGGFWSDFLNFRRQVDVTGWHFKGTLLLKNDVVVYKLIGGQPQIREMEYNSNPLGPLQGIGEATVRGVF
jgi:hypothetical protein